MPSLDCTLKASMPGPPPKTSSSRTIQTVTVLTVALIARLLVIWSVVAKQSPDWFFIKRGAEMSLLADSILSGHGLASPFGVPTGPTAFIAPGYPLLVAAVFGLFGPHSTASLLVFLILHIALNLATVWLILHLSRCLSGSRAAWIAGLFWSVSLPLVWMPTIFWDTCFSAFILLAFIAIALHWRGRFDRKLAMTIGAATAFVGLVNPALLPVLFCIILWLAFQSGLSPRYRVVRIALAASAFLVVFSPWPVRNARVFHAFIPLRTTVGFELWMGNRAGAAGFLDESVFPMYNPQELADYNTRGEVDYTAHKSELAKQYIAANPLAFASLTGRRIVRFWTGTGSQGGSPIFALHACLTSLFGILGLWMLRHRVRLASLFTIPLLLFPFPYYITHAEFRYRLVLDPLMTVLSGYALARISQRSRHIAALPVLHTEAVHV